MSKTPAQRGALGRRRKAAGQKAAATRRLRAVGQKALSAREQNEEGRGEGVTESRGAARKKTAVTRKKSV